MIHRLVDRLRFQGNPRLYGRDAELQLFRESLDALPMSSNVYLIHGPGGVGKTSLLGEMRAQAEAAGFGCIRLDGRDVEPSAYGVLKGLGLALGMDAAAPAPLPDVLTIWRQQPRRLLLIDTFEHLSHLEHWLREQLLAELPEQSLVVMAGRVAPSDFWRTDPAWRSGSHVLALRNLSSDDAHRALAARGLDASQRQAIVGLTYGHPLAMMLLADVVEASGDVPGALGPDVIRRLIDCFAAQLPSRLHRDALELYTQSRVTQERLLADLVDEASASALFDWLASLSFTEVCAEGLAPHDLVRDAIASELRWRHPERLKQLTTRLLEHHLAQAQAQAQVAGRGGRQRAALDIFYMNRGNPLMRQFIDFDSLGKVSCEPAIADDIEPIATLLRHELGPQHEALLRRWHGHPASTLWSVRDTQHEIAAAMLCLNMSALTPQEIAEDAGLAGFGDWLSRQPSLRQDEVALFARLSVARGGLLHGAAFINAMQARSVSIWMSESRLAAYAMVAPEPAHWAPMMAFIDFHPIDADGFVMDSQQQGIFAHDWRHVPLQEWLARMTRRMLQPATAHMAESEPPPLQVLSESMFREAVQLILKAWHQPAALRDTPLLQSRLVRGNRQETEDAEATLRRLVQDAVDALSHQARHQRFARALDLTYLHPMGSQELVAERLGIPYGTYRYQLRTAIDRVTATLWSQEHGALP